MNHQFNIYIINCDFLQINHPVNKSKLGFFSSIRNSIILNDSQICVFHEDFQQKKLRIQKKKLIKKEKKGKGKRRADLQVL